MAGRGQSFCLRIASHRFLLTSPDAGLSLRLRACHLPFLDPAPCDAEPAARLELRAAPPPAPAEGPAAIVSWESDTWRMLAAPDGRRALQIRDEDGRWTLCAEVTADFSSGTLFPHLPAEDGKSLFVLSHPCDQALILGRLAHRGGVMLHAGAAALDGRAYLFCGSSGAGKSTLCGLWERRGATVLNDDRVLLRVAGKAVHASGAPWHGVRANVDPREYPLAAALLIRHGPSPAGVRLNESAALLQLLSHSFLPLFDADAVSQATDTVYRLARRVPVFDFAFAPHPSAVNEALNLARHAGS